MNKIEARALLGDQPSWALRNMARALQMMTRMNNQGDWKRLEALRALGYKVTCRIPGGAREVATELRASRKQAKIKGRRIALMGDECAREYLARYKGRIALRAMGEECAREYKARYKGPGRV